MVSVSCFAALNCFCAVICTGCAWGLAILGQPKESLDGDVPAGNVKGVVCILAAFAMNSNTLMDDCCDWHWLGLALLL